MITFNVSIEPGLIECRTMYWLAANINGTDYLSEHSYSSEAACILAFLAGDVTWFDPGD